MNILKGIGLSILAFVLVIALSAGLGLVDLQFYKYFGVERANVEREIFKENKTYIEGMASDLAKYRFEMEKEKDETARMAIANLIRSKYADFDIETLKDESLKEFLRRMRGGY